MGEPESGACTLLRMVQFLSRSFHNQSDASNGSRIDESHLELERIAQRLTKTIMANDAYRGHEFDALKTRYDDQVALLRSITQLDSQLFTGYITLQLVLSAWLAGHPVNKPLVRAGLLLIDLTLCFIASRFLYGSYRRRLEIVTTIKNICEALGFTEKGIYLPNKAINPKTVLRAWGYWYIAGVWVAALGFVLVLFGALTPPTQN